MKPFPDQLIEARKKHGLTQDDLAAALHITRSTVSHWENGRYLPSPEQLEALKECLAEELQFPMQEEAVSDDAPAPAEETIKGNGLREEAAPVPEKQHRRFLLPAGLFLLGAGAALLVCLLAVNNKDTAGTAAVMPVQLRRNASAEAETFFLRTAEEPKAGRPYVYISFDKPEIHPALDGSAFKTVPGWTWQVYLTECGGSPFCVDEFSVFYFGKDGEYTRKDCSADQYLHLCGSNTLEAGCTHRIRNTGDVFRAVYRRAGHRARRGRHTTYFLQLSACFSELTEKQKSGASRFFYAI